MKLRHLLVLMSVWPIAAQAEIYKSVDADGHVTYSSTPLKGGKRIILEPNLSTPSPSVRSRSASTPENFPRVESVTQRSRDDTRRKILEDELGTEQRLLEEAQAALKEGESNPEVYRGQDGKTYRNVAKYQEKIKALNDQVDLHRKNIEALQTELSKLR